MEPVDNTEEVGLRQVMSKAEVKKVLNVLKQDESTMAANWSRRFKNNMEKLHSGDPYQVAEVLRNLSIRDREKGLSAGEKRMITKARQILISELSHATGKSEEAAEIMIDEVLDDAHGVQIAAVCPATTPGDAGFASGRRQVSLQASSMRADASLSIRSVLPARRPSDRRGVEEVERAS